MNQLLNNPASSALAKARRRGYAIGAFNISSLETLRAVINAAAKLKAPVIIETSSGETEFMGSQIVPSVVKIYARAFKVAAFSNLDHAQSISAVREGLQSGYDLVHFDGSKLAPARNARLLKPFVVQAHQKSRLVEGEREHIAGSSKIHNRKAPTPPIELTDPAVARAFVRQTGVDILAVSIGEAHGLYHTAKKIDIKRLQAIRRAVPCYLSLHGGSGIPGAQVRAAVRAGVSKINVNTELRLAYRQGMERALKSTDSIVPYEYLPAVVESVQRVVEAKIKLFGSAGQA